MADNVALNKKEQSKFNKQVKSVKSKVKKGIIKIKENVKTKKPPTPRGLIYLGHIPHGFYEEELKAYFKQFGAVTNVRLCRSRFSGRSKGYGFVEFRHPEVAQIAAETMDNYLMFNRRLICKYIPREKKARILFKKPAWSTTSYPKKEARKVHVKQRNGDVPEEKFSAKVDKAIDKIKKKMDKLTALGVSHAFRPADVPDDKQHLLEENTKIHAGEVVSNSVKKVKNLFKACKDSKKRSLKTIQKKKSSLPKPSFMQNDRLKRLAASELLNDMLVKKVDKIKKKRF